MLPHIDQKEKGKNKIKNLGFGYQALHLCIEFVRVHFIFL